MLKRYIMILSFFGFIFEIYSQVEIQSGIEYLFLEEVPMVTTAAKRPQKIFDAPATVEVITQSDLKKMGVTKLADALRTISGVNVAYQSAADPQVNIRNLARRRTNEVLVLIDGRTQYLDLQGNIIWESFPIVLEEVKQIEIVKGPGSVLYGANAYFGIINIITEKRNDDKKELSISLVEHNSAHTVLMSKKNDWSFKASGGYDQYDSWFYDDDSLETVKFNLFAEYSFDNVKKISIETGLTDGDIDVALGGQTGIAETRGTLSQYAKINFESETYSAKLFWNRFDFDLEFRSFKLLYEYYNQLFSLPIGQYVFPTENNVVDFEIVKNILWKEQHHFILGLSYRNNDVKTQIINEDQNTDLFAFFVENEWVLTNDLKVVTGLRVDDHSIVEEDFSPRLSLLYQFDDSKRLRLSASQAFRMPSIIELFLNLNFLGQSSIGNPDLETEKIRAYEISYDHLISQFLHYKTNLFYYNTYNRVSGFVNSLQANLDEDINSYGGELDVYFQPTDTTEIKLSFSAIKFKESTALTFIDQKDTLLMMNLSIYQTFMENLFFRIFVNAVDQTKSLTDKHEQVDVHTGWNMNEHISVSLLVENVFDENFYEMDRGGLSSAFALSNEELKNESLSTRRYTIKGNIRY